jgi:hypothetical protein
MKEQSIAMSTVNSKLSYCKKPRYLVWGFRNCYRITCWF